ncbi:MAG TPA: UDP-N-acetylmuramate--L-alanine ligase, partial [Cellulomonas sp.]
EQRLNAQPVVAEGGGLLVADEELTGDWIAVHLLPLLGADEEAAAERATMGAAAARVGVPDATARVADLVEDEISAAEQRAVAAAEQQAADAELAAAEAEAADEAARTEAADEAGSADQDGPAGSADDPAGAEPGVAAGAGTGSGAPTAEVVATAGPVADAGAEAGVPVADVPVADLPGAGAVPTAAVAAVVPGAVGPVAVADLGRVHLVGVGGAGMSAVAGLLVARGLTVSGSDAAESATLAGLREAGVRVHVGHDATHVADVDTLVVSSAIRATNPELVAARERGLAVLHRSDALAALMADRIGIAVAGAHGKTTTSAMVAAALGAVGREDPVLDPSYAIGGTVRTAAGPTPGYRTGTGDVFVAEADESDGSFLAYAPAVAVVTNVEPDHLDHYGSTEAFEAAFEAFADRVRDGGALVAGADDAGAARLVAAVDERLTRRGVRVLTYGRSETAEASETADAAHPVDLVVGPVQAVGGAWRVALTSRLADLPDAELTLAVPGDHNAANAAAAYLAAWAVGADPAVAARGLGEFRGTGRRFEDRGTVGGVRVVDDYAHHPTEVAALLRTARGLVGGGRVLVLFQPHLYSRTRTFAVEFGQALDLADVVVVTDVYAAREDLDPETTGDTLVQRVPTPGRATFVADRHAAARTIAAAARPGDLLLTVGAGDVTALAPEILTALGDDGATGPDTGATSGPGTETAGTETPGDVDPAADAGPAPAAEPGTDEPSAAGSA